MSPRKKKAEVGGGTVSPAEVQKYLSGVSYPTNKEDLERTAQQNGAPENVMSIIRQMPSEEYGGPQDVMKAYGEVKS